jgi:hypothetical protein
MFRQFMMTLIGVCLAISLGAQSTYSLPVSEIIQASSVGQTEPLRDWDYTKTFDNPVVKAEKLGVHVKHDWPLHEAVNPNALPNGADPAWQQEYAQTRSSNTLGLNQDGMGYTNVNPSDNILDVGPNHVIQMINGNSGALFTVLDKAGNTLSAPLAMDNFFGFSSGLGDPVVLYDALADRWFLAEFSSGSNDIYIAVSQTADPLGAWYTYTFTAPNFPDYLKFGVWTDMYIMTSNESGPSAIYAFDRNSMLAGLPATLQRFTVPDYPTIGFQATTPVTMDTGNPPPAGAPGMFMRMADDAWSTSIPSDRLELWEMDIDFASPGNSVVSGPQLISTDAFDTELCGYTSFSCFQQPGTGIQLDPLREVLMNRIQYKNFGTHEAIVCNHVTDVDNTDRGGIRWYELRRTGISNPWGIHQQGTYSPDIDSRFMAGIAINDLGDIALFYNVTSSSTFPGIRYTGRSVNDPLGTMTLAEATVVSGSASNGSNRYGDYNSLDVDPADGVTFWGTANYNPTSQWRTRIANFTISNPNCTAPTLTYQLNDLCGSQEFQASIVIGADGDATSYDVEVSVDGGAYSPLGNFAPGTVAIGTQSWGTNIQVRVIHPSENACNRTLPAVTSMGESCCTAPSLSTSLTTDCTSGTFEVSFVIGPEGSEDIYEVSYVVDGGSPVLLTNFSPGNYVLGSFPLGSSVDLTLIDPSFSACNQTITGITTSSICNDDCEGAIEITCNETISGSTVGATSESPDPGFCGTSAGTGGGVWYKILGVNSNDPSAPNGSIGDSLIVSVCNDGGLTGGSATYDTKIRVFSGSCGALTCETGIDDSPGCSSLSSIVNFRTIVGEEYFILVHGYSSSEGDFILSVDCSAPSTCPQPENLEILEVGDDYAIVSWDEVGTADGWKVQYGPEGHDPNDITQGTWFSTFGSTTFTFPDLEQFTSYDFYALSTCINPLEDSPWAGPVTFTTTGDICQGGIFLDSGGENLSYSNNEFEETVFCPTTVGDTISLTFTFVDIEVNTAGVGIQDGCWDFLTIYNGIGTSAPVLAQTLCGEESISGQTPSVPSSLLSAGDSFTSTDVTGCLTVTFSSDGSVVNQGWSADITCIPGPVACQAPTDLDVVEIDFGSSNPRVNATWTNPENTTDCQLRGGRISPATANSPNPQFANINNTRIVAQTNGSTVNFNIALYNNPNIPFTIGQTYGYEVRCQCADGSGYSDWTGIVPESTFVVPSFNVGGQSAGTTEFKTFTQAGLSLYPNPNDGDMLSVSFSNGTEERFILRVLDARGMLVMEQEFNSAKSGSQVRLDFESGLSSGLYLIQAIQGNQAVQDRFIVE